MDRNEIAGAVTLVARHGKIVHFDAQGSRDKEDNAPMQKDTIFSLMSMTKPIVSTALMMLFEEGRFMLDDPIRTGCRRTRTSRCSIRCSGSRVPTVRPVTIRHVLTHTSGLSLAPPTAAGRRPMATPPRRRRRARRRAARAAAAQAAATAAARERPKTLAEAIERAAS